MQPWGQIGFAGHGRQQLKALCRRLVLCAFVPLQERKRTAEAAQRSGAPMAPMLQDSALASALLSSLEKGKRRAPAKKHWPVSWWSHTEQVQLDAVLHKAWFATKARLFGRCLEHLGVGAVASAGMDRAGHVAFRGRLHRDPKG